jgi:hypothetical protein
LANTAEAWAEVLSELHPECSIVGTVDGISLDVSLDERERRLEAAA